MTKLTQQYRAGHDAQTTGRLRSYGPHYGMRSTYEADKAEFYRGWDAASRGVPLPPKTEIYDSIIIAVRRSSNLDGTPCWAWVGTVDGDLTNQISGFTSAGHALLDAKHYFDKAFGDALNEEG